MEVLTAEVCSILLRWGCSRLADPWRCRKMRRILISACNLGFFWNVVPSSGHTSGAPYQLGWGSSVQSGWRSLKVGCRLHIG